MHVCCVFIKPFLILISDVYEVSHWENCRPVSPFYATYEVFTCVETCPLFNGSFACTSGWISATRPWQAFLRNFCSNFSQYNECSCQTSRFDHISLLLCQLHWLKASECITYKVAVLAYKCQHGLAPSYLCDELHRPADSAAKTMTTFCLINISERSMYSSVHCRQQSVSCCSRSSVEQSSIASLCTLLLSLSPSSAVILNHISSNFLIPPSDSSFICGVRAVTRHFGHYKSLLHLNFNTLGFNSGTIMLISP